MWDPFVHFPPTSTCAHRSGVVLILRVVGGRTPHHLWQSLTLTLTLIIQLANKQFSKHFHYDTAEHYQPCLPYPEMYVGRIRGTYVV